MALRRPLAQKFPGDISKTFHCVKPCIREKYSEKSIQKEWLYPSPHGGPMTHTDSMVKEPRHTHVGTFGPSQVGGEQRAPWWPSRTCTGSSLAVAPDGLKAEMANTCSLRQPHQCRGQQGARTHLTVRRWLSASVRAELHLMWKGQGSNLHLQGMLAPQTGALPAMLQCQPPKMNFSKRKKQA